MNLGRRSVFNTRLVTAYLSLGLLMSVGGRELGLDPLLLVVVLVVAAVVVIVLLLRHREDT